VPAEIDPIPGPQVLSQLEDTVTYGLAVTENPSFKALQANPDLYLRLFVAKRLKPASDGFLAVGSLVAKNFNHYSVVGNLDDRNASETRMEQGHPVLQVTDF